MTNQVVVDVNNDINKSYIWWPTVMVSWIHFGILLHSILHPGDSIVVYMCMFYISLNKSTNGINLTMATGRSKRINKELKGHYLRNVSNVSHSFAYWSWDHLFEKWTCLSTTKQKQKKNIKNLNTHAQLWPKYQHARFRPATPGVRWLTWATNCLYPTFSCFCGVS